MLTIIKNLSIAAKSMTIDYQYVIDVTTVVGLGMLIKYIYNIVLKADEEAIDARFAKTLQQQQYAYNNNSLDTLNPKNTTQNLLNDFEKKQRMNAIVAKYFRAHSRQNSHLGTNSVELQNSCLHELFEKTKIL